MDLDREPEFLTREMVDDLHNAGLDAHGGLRGLLNDHLLESAVNQPQHTYHIGGGDLFEIAAAYAFHIILDHPYWDGNKRTGALAARQFLEINGIDTTR